MQRLMTQMALIATAAMISACSTTPTAKTEAPAPPPAAKAAEAPPPPPSSQMKAASMPVASGPGTLPPYLDPHNALSSDRSVFFAFDGSDIKTDGTETILRNGKYLSNSSAVKVRIEGNCDERGSAEYNLALGQRRADAVATRLRDLGVRSTQLETVSYGKEKPRASGHDEEAWKQNRRADIVYPST